MRNGLRVDPAAARIAGGALTTQSVTTVDRLRKLIHVYRQEAWGDGVDSIALVGEQINAGRKLIERLKGAGIPVSAAAWVKPTERFHWYLYLVTPLVGEDGAKKLAYIYPPVPAPAVS